MAEENLPTIPAEDFQMDKDDADYDSEDSIGVEKDLSVSQIAVAVYCAS